MNAIRTDRLLLRRARWSDLEPLHAVLSDPRAMLYWSTLPHSDLDRTREWLGSMIEAPPDRSDDYVIECDDEVIGKAGCWRLPEIGFILHPDRWGQGYAIEAVGAAVCAVFARHALDRITADVDPRNAASIGLLRRLGFEETGRASRTWQIGEKWCDSVYFALSRDAFQSRHGGLG